MNRLTLVEGLRAYLAMWVLVGHVLMAAGYDQYKLSGFALLLGQNWYAVDVFVIVSGFVIFFLLDNKHETYGVFICRRFFRLYPLFIILFIVSIPSSLLYKWDLEHSKYLTLWGGRFLDQVNSEWKHWQWNVLWHLPMLHGIVPDSKGNCTGVAFLGQAWSVSLEWQFYLIAPLAYLAAVSRRPLKRVGICVFCLYLFLGKDLLTQDVISGYSGLGAFLPFHVEYFFVGSVSYFIFREIRHIGSDVYFPVAACIAWFFWNRFTPFCIWIVFLGLLLENPASYSAKILYPLFSHAVVQFLGRISYSIYLSHMLVLYVAEYFVLRYMPNLSSIAYFWILLVATVGGTVLASAMLYRFVESPGIRYGAKFASRFRKFPVPHQVK